MIQIKCTKTQFQRIIKALSVNPLENNRCVLGKTEKTCPSLNNKVESCQECLRQHIEHIT